jgi:hypothetical protein
MGKLDDLISAVGKAAPESKYIRAYHASPFDFDRFDFSSTSRKGLGSENFGRGGYFAENPKVEEFYRREIGDRSDAYISPADAARQAEWEASFSDIGRQYDALLRERGVRDDTFGLLLLPDGDPDDLALAAQAELLNKQRPQIRRGRSYEVEIGHSPKSLLDYDAVLSEQPHMLPAVEQALKKIKDPSMRDDFMGLVEEPADSKGVEVYNALHTAGAADAGLSYGSRGYSAAGNEAASRALMDVGIPGLRYLDGQARRVGQGTRNMVMFPGTEDSIRILRKYGLLAPMAAGAASPYGEE